MSAKTRAQAARVLVAVVRQGRSLSEALPEQADKIAASERSLLAELCYGVLRHYFELDWLAQQLLQKPFKDKDADVHALLLVGLYQLRQMRIGAHAAVDLTVEAAKSLKKVWAGGLLNAVLRNYQRREAELSLLLQRQPDVTCNHPLWLAQLIKHAWPEQAETVFAGNNGRGGMTLRVNVRRYRREQYQALLAEVGIVSQALAGSETALALNEPVAVQRLPEFEQGACSVQDLAAQRCAPLMQLAAGQTVLDACAAPGGKTCHIAESEPGLARLLAIDSDVQRLPRLRDNLARLQLNAEVICADASRTDWAQGAQFDRILLDVPCSGTGVIRRHPDIKHLRRPQDIDDLVQRQRRILNAQWSLLQPGGLLLYTTCSILPAENEQQVAQFVATTADCDSVPLAVEWGIATGHGRQLLPAAEHDGFFYALLRKKI